MTRPNRNAKIALMTEPASCKNDTPIYASIILDAAIDLPLDYSIPAPFSPASK